MAGQKLRSIRNHIFRYARALDVARWNFHFENGSVKEVLKALVAYKNVDGGFGHGLEPDNQNPDSTPIGTWAAVRVLREMDFPAEALHLYGDMHRYLLEHAPFDGRRWPRTVPSNNDWPHAPWWTHPAEVDSLFNPTAELAGFLLRTARPGTAAYTAGEEVVRHVLEKAGTREFEGHELVNITALVEDLAAAGREELLPDGFREEVARQVHARIEQDPEMYTEDAYFITPKYYIDGKSSPYYEQNRDICAFYADWLEETVGKDGSWTVSWNWGEREMLENARRDWKGSLIVDNMLYLQGMKPDLTTIG